MNDIQHRIEKVRRLAAYARQERIYDKAMQANRLLERLHQLAADNTKIRINHWTERTDHIKII